MKSDGLTFVVRPKRRKAEGNRKRTGSLRAEKFKAEALIAECQSLTHQVALCKDDIKLTQKVVEELSANLDESKLAIEAKGKELEDKKVQYVELYEESMSVVRKGMLKVRVELFHEFQEGKSLPWDIAKAIKDYENWRPMMIPR